jgi:predicted thioesterase
MKNIFEVGHTMRLVHTVEQTDLATFETGNVHPFYSTFALGRDAEWTCRQFVLQMKEDDEEGIGTFLNIRHKSRSAWLCENFLIS